ncbi:acyloxyacyl hydrolase [Tamlana haliotis]|uniref:Acyloxyacyl hydrolase n=1 Tax=Pseudotamlana haliotis TaxID=2614804 RepID=A0A6N6ME23_9FLAO|nr:acyloxyacyl hydrolase [Tamlana haliotis]KAB1068447.1 acyloxyacyl hydrolase [Tamlana haliotis]
MKYCLFSLCCLLGAIGFGQGKKHTSTIDLSYFYGNIAEHNPSMAHLITGHPEGFMLSWNRKTYGFEDWEQRYNYPGFGVTYAFQNMKNEYLGSLAALYAHYNLYFLKRHLMFRVGQGVAYTENPYDKETNYRNIAFGSKLLSSTFLMLNYRKERIFDRFGLQAGLTLIHYSNGSFKSPNTSTNSVLLNVGVTYNIDEVPLEYQHTLAENDRKFTEPFRFNFTFSSGITESDVVDSGQFPFYTLSAAVDKRITRKSAFQLGTEVFFTMAIKELIAFYSVAYPEADVAGDEDYKRVGVFVGHELFINKLSVIGQLGYYAYYPYDFEGRVYLRLGMKQYFGKRMFGKISIKSHGAKAEAVEFGLGIRI